MEFTIGELIDRLSIINLKIWHATERILDKSNSDEEAGKASRQAEAANAERRELIAAINKFFNQYTDGTAKL